MKRIVLVSLLLWGCAQWGPRSDDEVLEKRDFTKVAHISQVPESDPRGLYDIRVENDSLKLSARFSGGCRAHEFTLYAAYEKPNVVSIYVRHNANGDLCRAWFEAYPVAFDLRKLKKDFKMEGPVTLVSHPGEFEPFSVVYP